MSLSLRHVPLSLKKINPCYRSVCKFQRHSKIFYLPESKLCKTALADYFWEMNSSTFMHILRFRNECQMMSLMLGFIFAQQKKRHEKGRSVVAPNFILEKQVLDKLGLCIMAKLCSSVLHGKCGLGEKLKQGSRTNHPSTDALPQRTWVFG